MNNIDFSQVFTNPAVMAVVGYAVANGLRSLLESEERTLPAWFPYAIATGVAIVFYLAGEFLSADQKGELVDILTIVAGVLGAGGVSVLAASRAQKKAEDAADVQRGFAAAPSPSKPNPQRAWFI